MWLLVIQIIVFLSYVIGIVSRYGVLESISDSWYRLPLKYNALFTFFTWGLGIPMLLYGSDALFFSGVGLCFVGAATRFKMGDFYTTLIHFSGAVAGVLLPLLYFGFSYGIWWPFLLQLWGSVFIYAYDKIENSIWWIEILGFITVLSGLYLILPELDYVGIR